MNKKSSAFTFLLLIVGTVLAVCVVDYQMRIKCVEYDSAQERCIRAELR